MSSRTTKIRAWILGALLALILGVALTIISSNAYQYTHTVVDSCGNTAQTLAATNILRACTTVSGQIEGVNALADGELMVQLEPNLASSYARNTVNQGLQGGNLLIILPCSSTAPLPTQYFQTCAAFHSTDIYPAISTPLTYTGNLVINQQFGWIQMQPVNDLPGA